MLSRQDRIAAPIPIHKQQLEQHRPTKGQKARRNLFGRDAQKGVSFHIVIWFLLSSLHAGGIQSRIWYYARKRLNNIHCTRCQLRHKGGSMVIVVHCASYSLMKSRKSQDCKRMAERCYATQNKGSICAALLYPKAILQTPAVPKKQTILFN